MRETDTYPEGLFDSMSFRNGQFRAALDHLPSPFAVLGPVPKSDSGKAADLRFIYINKAGSEFLLEEPDNILRTNISEYLSGEIKESFIKECYLTLKTGKPITIKALFFNLKAETGQVRSLSDLYISSLGSGIALSWKESRTEYHTEENFRSFLEKLIPKEKSRNFESLLQELSWLESIMAQIPSGISIAEAPSGKLLYHNKQAIRLLRHPLRPTKDYKGYAQYGAMHDFNTPYLPEEYPIARALFGETVIGQEMLYLRGDGTYTYFSVNAAPIRNAHREIIAAISTFDDTGDIKQTELALRETENRYMALFHNRTMAIAHCRIVTDMNGTPVDYQVLLVNEAYIDLTGKSRGETEGRLARELFPGVENYSFDFIGNFGQVALGGAELNTEVYIDNLKLWLSLYAYSPKKGEFIAIYNDITDRKEAGKLLSISEAMLEAFFDASPGILNLFDEELRYIKTDRTTPGYFGLDQKSITGRSVKELNPVFAREFLVPMLNKVTGSGVAELNLVVPGPIPSRNNETGYWLVSYFPLPLQNGKTGLGVMGVDITEIKLAQDALRLSEAKLLEAQKMAGIGNFTVNYEENRSIEWSEEMFRIFELDPAKGFPAIDQVNALVHPDDRKAVSGKIEKLRQEKTRQEFEYRVLLPGDKIKYIHTIINPVLKHSGELSMIFGTSMDITQRKLSELRYIKMLEELERSNKELEQFAYAVSHDLQEPLRMVSNFTKLLVNRYKDKLDSKADEFLGFINEGSRRMSSQIQDLLTYSRISTRGERFESLDMNLILKDVLTNLEFSITESGAVINSQPLPVIDADPVQMKQLLQNLLSNALKFKSSRKPEIGIYAVKDQKEWIFSIIDNGIGIEPQYYERIFVIFQRLNPERDIYPGTGIGLSLCKKIVERHSGKIWVTSEPGKGSTFYFSLPEKQQ